MSRPAYMLTPSLGNYNLKILNFQQKICLYIKFKSYFGQKRTYSIMVLIILNKSYLQSLFYICSQKCILHMICNIIFNFNVKL